jgi:hypothetical protein
LEENEQERKREVAKRPFLGVSVGPVPKVLAIHLADVLRPDEGLLIAEVAPNSPAAKAGLKQHDILLTYDDQKLSSAEQLVRLVRGDKLGREVTLGVVKAGKLEKQKVVLEQHDVAPFPGFPEGLDDRAEEFRGLLRDRGFPDGGPFRFRFRNDWPDPDAIGTAGKSQFSSMSLRSLDAERFRAEIEYKDEAGEVKKWSFEGTREEIRRDLQESKEVPAQLRRQMLRNLDFSRRPGAGMGSFRLMMPRLGGGIFIDSDLGEFGFPEAADFEGFFEEVDPQTRDQLKGTLRSIDEPQRNPVERDRSL